MSHGDLTQEHSLLTLFHGLETLLLFCLSPFSIIANCLATEDKSTELLIVPLWTTQPWFTLLLNLVMEHSLLLPQSDTLLVQPNSNAVQPISQRLQLMVCNTDAESPLSTNTLQCPPALKIQYGLPPSTTQKFNKESTCAYAEHREPLLSCLLNGSFKFKKRGVLDD